MATGGPDRTTLGQNFTNRNNSLNFLRLVLAVGVVASHAIPLGGFMGYTIHGRTTIGTLSVFGFFGISGYLVSQSAANNSTGRFLWQRFLRIFPGFWVCLLVVVTVFGTIGWVQASPHPHACGVGCYLPTEGLSYFVHNFFLRITHPYVLGTQPYHGVPLEDSSLWTLFYEFLCYVILALLAATRLLRRPLVVAVLAGGTWIAGLVLCVTPHGPVNFDLAAMIALVPVFLTGTLIYLYRDRIPNSGWIALVSGLVVIMSPWAPFGHTQYNFLTNYVTAGSSVDLLAPAIVYPLLWLGIHLPFQRIGSRNDYSYGLYIYAFPVQRLLAMWNVQRFGYVVYLIACVACTLPFAVASWWLVERNALKLKKVDPSQLTTWLLGPKPKAAEPTQAANPSR